MALILRPWSLSSPEATALIAALNAEMSAIYPEPGATHFALHTGEVAPGRGLFLVAWLDERPVGCGAVRLIGPDTAEIKRMYVAPGVRGRSVGRRLLERLESEARRLGARRLVLETGVRSPEALALYRHTGFSDIPLYGEYCLSPATSVCLGKVLEQGPGEA